MSTLLADPPAAPSQEQPPAPEPPGAAPGAAAPVAGERKCKNCGASMEAAQEWCLHCGTPAPGSLGTRGASWRSSAVVLGATALLALGAAGAAYAALTKTKLRHVVVVQIPAEATAAASAKPPATTPTSPATATTPKPTLPRTAVRPPKIPLSVPTPKATTTPKTTTTPAPAATVPTSTPKRTTPKKTVASNPAAQLPPAVLLDTNSISTYNPENYPAEAFGEPTLAVDGDTSTSWTARVEPVLAPKMAAGLLIDLNTPLKLSALQLITSTPGMTVQVFASDASAAPATITDPSWTALSTRQLQKERHTLIKLSNSTKAFRFVTLWISGAPPGSIGTAAAPGSVSVNEVELFPAK